MPTVGGLRSWFNIIRLKFVLFYQLAIQIFTKESQRKTNIKIIGSRKQKFRKHTGRYQSPAKRRFYFSFNEIHLCHSTPQLLLRLHLSMIKLNRSNEAGEKLFLNLFPYHCLGFVLYLLEFLLLEQLNEPYEIRY